MSSTKDDIVDEIVGGMAWALWLAINADEQARIAGRDLAAHEVNVGPDDPDATTQKALIQAACDLANVYQQDNHQSLDELADDPDDLDGPGPFGMELMMLSLGKITPGWSEGDIEWFRTPRHAPPAIPRMEYSIDRNVLTWTIYSADKVNPALFRHPAGVHVADRQGGRATARYGIPAAGARVTPRVDHRAAVQSRWGRGIDAMASKVAEQPAATAFKPKRGPGRPRKHQKNPTDTHDPRFPFVCKHCKRAIAELFSEPGEFIDANELGKTCPAHRDGHQPIEPKKA